MKHFEAILAVDLENGLGYRNTLPWHIPEDLKRFQNLTLGKNVVLGSKTAYSILDSLGSLLPRRNNIILSHSAKEHPMLQQAGAKFIDLEKLLLTQEHHIIAGGETVYRALIPFCSVVYLTVVHKRFVVDCRYDIGAIKQNFILREKSSFFSKQENCIVDFETWDNHYQ